MKKPLCKREGFRYIPSKDGRTMNLLPAKKLRPHWILLQGDEDKMCDAKVTRTFATRAPNSEMVLLEKTGHNLSDISEWAPEFIAAFERMSANSDAETPAITGSLSDLPLVEVPTTENGDSFAILLSGDGGWAGIDKDIAAALAEKGVPVAAFDSLRYFWTVRTPEGLATDLDRVLKYYANLWKRSRVILIGYSQGANVLPFALNRLPPETRSLVGQTVLMGLHDKASFEFHFGNWFEDNDEGIPLLPEMVKLAAESTLCVYGEDEEDSFCPNIPAGHVQAVSLPGGHHFDGDYDRLAELILAWSQKPEDG